MLRAKVPATSANLGPGFDTLGMALQFYNHFSADPAPELSVEIGPGNCIDVGGMSLDPDKNLLAKAYQAYFSCRGESVIPARLVIEAHIPLSRGMGSSSSALVGGMMLANSLHPQPLPKADLLPWLIELEGHPDNVAPALLGGVCCCFPGQPVLSFTWPESWGIVLVIPPHPVSTEAARKIMPPHYTREEAMLTMQGLAAWVYAIQHRNEEMMRFALAADRLHEPARAQLIPEWQVVKSALQGVAGHLGTVISGSGSTIAVFSQNLDAARHFEMTLKTQPDLAACKIISVRPDSQGAQVSG